MSLAVKRKYTSSQLKLSKTQRKKNLQEAFELLDLSSLPTEATILLVDDVVTTGSTLLALAKLIKDARPDLQIW